MVKKTYNAGDLVFARVKGFPPWPAKITAIAAKDKYNVYFYGTYETAVLKHTDIFDITKENQDKFIAKNEKRRFYMKGITELITSPDIAPGPKAIPLIDPPDIDKITTATPNTSGSGVGATPARSSIISPPTVRKPFKVSSGSPVKRALSSSVESNAVKTPLRPSSGGMPTPATLPKRQRRGSKVSNEEVIVSPPVFSTPQTSSRSGRVIKQKRFGDEDSSLKQDASPGGDGVRADSQIDDPRKIWVKRRSTGELFEIRLSTDRPAGWKSEKQKLSWNLATARNAVKLKEFVELGEFIPDELIQEIKKKTELTEEEKCDLQRVAEQTIRRERMAWLMKEEDLVQTEYSIRKALPPQNPDTDECVRLLKKLLFNFDDFDKFMLVKQPILADTIDKLKRYKGSKIVKDNMDAKEMDRLEKNVTSIKNMASTLHKKLLALFNFKESKTADGGSKFSAHLQQEYDNLLKATQHMSQQQRLVLTEYPQ